MPVASRSALLASWRLDSSPISSIADALIFFPLFVSPGWSCRRLALLSPYQCSIEYAAWLRLLAFRCCGWWRCSHLRHLIMRCRPAFPACLRLVSIVALIVVSPLLDTVGRGVRRGASGVLCLLDFILRSVPISADVDSRFVPFPSSAVSSLGLLALSARLRGR